MGTVHVHISLTSHLSALTHCSLGDGLYKGVHPLRADPVAAEVEIHEVTQGPIGDGLCKRLDLLVGELVLPKIEKLQTLELK